MHKLKSLQRLTPVFNAPRFSSIRQYATEHELGEAEEIPALNRTVERSLNQVTLLGRVGADPQCRGTPEHPVTLFSLATTLTFKSAQSGQTEQRVEWHRVCIFKPGLRDSVFEFLNKGQRALVQGRLSYSTLKDSTGKEYQAANIIADNVVFLSPSKKQPE